MFMFMKESQLELFFAQLSVSHVQLWSPTLKLRLENINIDGELKIAKDNPDNNNENSSWR